MNYGYYRVSSITPQLILGDIEFNTNSIISHMNLASSEQISVAVFPELAVSGYTNSDLFYNDLLINKTQQALTQLVEASKALNTLFVIGLPYRHLHALYNAMAVLFDGKLLGIVTKTHMFNYQGGFEHTYFKPGPKRSLTQEGIPLGSHLLFRNANDPSMVVGVEICEDFWVPNSPSIEHALAGATIIANGCASYEEQLKPDIRRDYIKATSRKLKCAYLVAASGTDESTTDVVYGAHNLIAENGDILIESDPFMNESIAIEVDVEKLVNRRRKQSSFDLRLDTHDIIDFDLKPEHLTLSRVISSEPFTDEADFQYMSSIQAEALKRRLTHTKTKVTLLGLSGGQDSTLALLAIKNAYDLMGLSMDHCYTVSMPGLGTSSRTFNNAEKLAKALGTTYLEIDIKESVLKHFEDISHDQNVQDAVYENAQARERTQILMDLANKYQGLVVGTGDLSELALGWATYNGDHMSMYGVNAGIPKTLIQPMIYHNGLQYSEEIQAVLADILDTPISPELLPHNNNEITQKTQDLIGPYKLHDFFLYHLVENGFGPRKIRYLAKEAFDHEEIDKWLRVFISRFFSQQYKRSALPDGPRMSGVSLSPRSGHRMPSDASSALWLRELDDAISEES